MRIHTNNPLCPYCKSALEQNTDIVACSGCRTFYHHECWEANGQCSVFGCFSSNMLASQSLTLKSKPGYRTITETPPHTFKWTLRWILVLPASIGAALISNLVAALYHVVAGFFGHSEPLFWIQLINSGLCGYYFVYGGTKTAPVHRPIVAIVLTVLFGIWEAFVVNASLRVGDNDPSYPLWWFIVTTIVAIVAAIVACVKLQEA